MKKTLHFLFCILGILFILMRTVYAEENLSRNASFEEKTVLLFPEQWQLHHWEETNSITVIPDDIVFKDGTRSFYLEVSNSDDTRIQQTIKVKPNTWYAFSAWIKTEDVGTNQVGAHISVMGSVEHSPDIRGTQDWQKIQVYGKTAYDQLELDFAARLGFYGSTNSGKVWFDGLEVKVVNAPPYGAPKMALNAPAPLVIEEPELQLSSSDSMLHGFTILISISFLMMGFILSRQPSKLMHFSFRFCLSIAALVVLPIKLWLAAYYYGYTPDIKTFTAWAANLNQLGAAKFYRPDHFADYPPGYMYFLWIIGFISQHLNFGFESKSFLMLLKSPAILADLLSMWLLYSVKYPNKNNYFFYGRLAALLWLFNPLVFLNSSVWGQVDSIFTLVVGLALIHIENRRYIFAAVLYTVAVLLKPQALLIGPLVLIVLWKMPTWKIRFTATIVGVSAGIILILPFAWNQDPFWIFSLYSNTLGNYNYITLNAFNLYALLDANWLATETLFLGLPSDYWSWFLVTLGLFFICWLALTKKASGSYLFSAFAIYILFFVVGPKMHERYLFPAALLGFITFIWIQDRRLLWMAIAVSVSSFLNTLITLDYMTRFNTSLVPYNNLYLLSVSFINVSLLSYVLYLGWDIFKRQNIVRLEIIPYSSPSNFLMDHDLTSSLLPPLTRRTYLQLIMICVLYAIIAFSGLGSLKTPKTFWKPLPNSEAALFNMTDPQTISVVEWFHGLGTGNYKVEFSEDGVDWNKSIELSETDAFAEFRWRQVFIDQQFRYIKIQNISGNLDLHELIIRDPAGQRIGLQHIQGPSDAQAIIDEPSSAIKFATHKNGMYFDEIYHARSAWEIIHGIDATENTHPPLGKIIIAGGIKLFGMNPFGFRFMGVLFGVLMLPVFFAITRRLFYSNRYALVATALLAFDFMHFTQTRIATIDTYGVFFILCSSYYLLCFLQHEPSKHNWKLDRNTVLLGGLFFGLGVASKWIVLYAGVGFALLYMWQLSRQFKISHTKNNKQFHKNYFNWLTQSIAFGFCGFVILPIIIMCLAYWPHLTVTQTGLDEVWKSQLHMWDYHKNVTASHPFSSQWYEWPFMLTPIAYYVNSQWFMSGLTSNIIAFGNPIIWYIGSIAFIIAGWAAIQSAFKKHVSFALGFILISGLAQFLPWALIPRKLVFIYHFFATVPFIILALVWFIRQMERRLHNVFPKIKYLSGTVVVFSALFFILYFPIISGIAVPQDWSNFLLSIPPIR
ncbi:MAG: phospholipid carrier-dependent glycosyltransferase [Pseudomonadota bacterium]